MYSCNTAAPDAETVHRRMGHPSYGTLAEMAKNGAVKGLSVAPEEFLEKQADQCEPCLLGKQARAAHPNTGTQRQPLQVLHSDIMGPLPASIGGAVYIITLIDDATGFAVIGTLTHKSEAAAWLQAKIKMLMTLTNRPVQAFRSDCGGEYLSTAFKQFLEQQGIQQQLSAPYTPQMNGKAERFNKTLLQRIRAMLIDSKLSNGFWAEAAYAAVHALNRTVAQGEKCTPVELLLGQKPTIEHLRVFGCTAFYVQPSQQQGSKLNSVGIKAVMVGYDLAFKSYRLWDPAAHRVIITPNVVFDEQRMATTAVLPRSTDPPFDLEALSPPSPASPGPAVQPAGQGQAVQPVQQGPVLPAGQGGTAQLGDASQQGGTAQRGSAAQQTQQTAQLAQGKREGGSLSPELGQGLDTDSSGDSAFEPHQPLHSKTARRSSALKIPKRFAAAVAAVTAKGEQSASVPAPEPAAQDVPEVPQTPRTLQEALSGPQREQWRAAIYDELQAHEENGTWTLSKVPANVRPVPNKWVFRIKTDQHGRVTAYKARLVAKGFAQRWGVDFDQTYSPVCRTATIRTLLALVALHDWDIMQLDVTAAFLNGELDELIYMQQPPGFEQHGPDVACRLRKAIYGLKQAPKAWYDKISGQLRSLGFSVADADAGLFVLRHNGVPTYLIIHVDDMLVVGPQTAEVRRVKDLLGQAFKVKEVSGGTYLGMEISRDRAARTLHIGQQKYVHELLQRFDMQNAKSSRTPVDPSVKLTKEVGEGVSRIDPISSRYMELVGCLMYLATHTRPDLSFAVGQLARFMQYATTQHMQAAKLVLRYLAGTASYGLRYGTASASGGWEVTGDCGNSVGAAADPQRFFGYADASYANDIDTRRSTTGFVFMLNGGAVSWSSKLQPTVAVSTTEAEYMATAAAIKEALWFRKLLDDLGEGLGAKGIELRMDNQGSMHILMHPSSSVRSKHIDVQYHFAREKVCSGEVKPVYVSTSEMVADCLTKALAPAKFEPCKASMGVSKV
jgi:transposase InsO family protein